ncbi:hypothetical protein TRVL_05692 [Trypanosoma vivax]|nr:hypothetical protein TRVL_05692 [Trypanosoma vivax]
MLCLCRFFVCFASLSCSAVLLLASFPPNQAPVCAAFPVCGCLLQHFCVLRPTSTRACACQFEEAMHLFLPTVVRAVAFVPFSFVFSLWVVGVWHSILFCWEGCAKCACPLSVCALRFVPFDFSPGSVIYAR